MTDISNERLVFGQIAFDDGKFICRSIILGQSSEYVFEVLG